MYIPAQAGGGFSSPELGTHGFGGIPAVDFAGQKNGDIENGNIKPEAPKEQLYNLRKDFRQTNNVIRDHPEIAEAMKRRLDEIREANGTRL
jgi:hypothetical protein